MFAGFVARIEVERLPRGVASGEMVGGKGYSGGQEKDGMVRPEEDMTEFGMKFEWQKSAQKGGKGFRRVEVGTEALRRAIARR